jgi:hypothetical protein
VRGENPGRGALREDGAGGEEDVEGGEKGSRKEDVKEVNEIKEVKERRV